LMAETARAHARVWLLGGFVDIPLYVGVISSKNPNYGGMMLMLRPLEEPVLTT